MSLGRTVGPFEGCLSPELLTSYAAATKDPSPAVQAGEAVPPVAIVTQIWTAQNEARDVLVSADFQRSAVSGVHGEHEVRLHRPLVPGEPVTIWVDACGARPAGRNSAVTLTYTARDTMGAVVAEQWWTTVFLGVTCDEVGAPPPEHAFPPDARDRPIGTYVVGCDDAMAQRYADASGDWSGHHFDLAAARQSGFDRLFVHGLCTLALCAQAVVQLAAAGDPTRVRRVAARFASPVFLGEPVNVAVFDAGDLGIAFEADSGGAPVITHGRAELF